MLWMPLPFGSVLALLIIVASRMVTLGFALLDNLNPRPSQFVNEGKGYFGKLDCWAVSLEQPTEFSKLGGLFGKEEGLLFG